IGDGVLVGTAELAAAAAAFDRTALVVLTDGQENAPAWLADVTGSLTGRVLAIGLGEPADIDPAALATLVDDGGWLAVSGTLSTDERFLLAQYFLQVLAGVTNEQVVVT